MTIYICPECATGKHLNCNGQAWDTEADQPTACNCTDEVHGPRDTLPERNVEIVPIKDSWDVYRDPTIKVLTHHDREEIRELLVGHKVTKVFDDHLLMDDGTLLKMKPNQGGCACSAGDYFLTALNGVDNIITDVKFDYRPGSDEVWPRPDDYGYYRIFVFADNQQINLMQADGDDGNGYYGTGFEILVQKATVRA